MRLRTIPACIGVALVALATSAAASATSTTPAGSPVPALKRAGLSWVTYAINGNAPKACRLQVGPSVGGVPCEQLPTYDVVIYCNEPPKTDVSPWRTPAQLVKRATIKGSKGTVVYRASRKKSKRTATATFSKVDGAWRIVSLKSGGLRLSPAGLIFTDGKDLRQELWPPHC